jgi:hypothetical protein
VIPIRKHENHPLQLEIGSSAVMSIRLHPQDVIQGPGDDVDSGSCLSSSNEDEDQNDPKTWDDWVSDSQENRECYSFFEDKKLASVAKAIEYDEQTHGFNLDRVSSKLGEPDSFRYKLLWWIRLKSKISFTSSRFPPACQTHQLHSQTGHSIVTHSSLL